MVNQADLYRAKGQDQLAIPLLKQALKIDPQNAATNYAMGLLMIRLKQLDKATDYLKITATQTPENSHYNYVYAVALFESGKQELAVSILKKALQSNPNDSQIISALAAYLTTMGRMEEAREYSFTVALGSVQVPQKSDKPNHNPLRYPDNDGCWEVLDMVNAALQEIH